MDANEETLVTFSVTIHLYVPSGIKAKSLYYFFLLCIPEISAIWLCQKVMWFFFTTPQKLVLTIWTKWYVPSAVNVNVIDDHMVCSLLLLIVQLLLLLSCFESRKMPIPLITTSRDSWLTSYVFHMWRKELKFLVLEVVYWRRWSCWEFNLNQKNIHHLVKSYHKRKKSLAANFVHVKLTKKSFQLVSNVQSLFVRCISMFCVQTVHEFEKIDLILIKYEILIINYLFFSV